jgi:hypothetical protein
MAAKRENRLESAEFKLMNSENQLTASEMNPAGSENISGSNENIPAIFEKNPTGSEKMPGRSEMKSGSSENNSRWREKYSVCNAKNIQSVSCGNLFGFLKNGKKGTYGCFNPEKNQGDVRTVPENHAPFY